VAAGSAAIISAAVVLVGNTVTMWLTRHADAAARVASDVGEDPIRQQACDRP
jgi:hypothetical protein